jgi:hypothetical protein
MEVSKINELEWARLAMAIDCEGSIRIAKQKDIRRIGGYRYYVAVHIYNTNEALIDYIVGTFGFSKWEGRTSRSPNHKIELMAYLARQKAETILYGIKPYLIIKEQLADIALELQSTMGNYGSNRVPSDVLEHRENLWQQAKELNRKGPKAGTQN